MNGSRKLGRGRSSEAVPNLCRVLLVGCGVRCWTAFAAAVLGRKGRELPPDENGLVAWSVLFRCEAVKRATVAIEKRGNFHKREPKFIRCQVLVKLMKIAIAQHFVEEAMLYLAACVFLLRVPSKALPMCRSDARLAAMGQATRVCCRSRMMRLF